MLNRTLAFMKFGMQRLFAYKFEVAFWMFVTPVILATQYFLWKAVFGYSGATVIRGFTFNGMMNYFILSQIAGMFVWINLDTVMSNHIRDGTLVIDLIRPVTLFKSAVANYLGENLAVIALQIVPLIAIGVFLFNFSFTSWPALILSMVSFSLAMFLSLTFVFFVGLSSFWITRYTGVKWIRDGLTWFLGGGVIPLSFFPEIGQKIASVLPFKYMIYAPVQIYNGYYAGFTALTIIAIQIVWIILLYTLIQVIMPRAMARFSAVGG